MASSDEEDQKTIVLRSVDGEEFEVEEAAARQSYTLRCVIDDGSANDAIPLPNVDARTLAKVIEYCSKHAAATRAVGDDRNAHEDIDGWDAVFMDVDQAVLYDILLAANYLEIKGLLDLACSKVANMIKGKSVEEIRTTFNIKNDFTPEEEEEIWRQNRWAFE